MVLQRCFPASYASKHVICHRNSVWLISATQHLGPGYLSVLPLLPSQLYRREEAFDLFYISTIQLHDVFRALQSCNLEQ